MQKCLTASIVIRLVPIYSVVAYCNDGEDEGKNWNNYNQDKFQFSYEDAHGVYYS